MRFKIGDNIKYSFDSMSGIMFDHMSEGKSYSSLAPQLGVTRATLYRWEKKYPEWREAKKIANEMRLLAIEELLLDLATGRVKGQAAAAIFYAKNACPEHFKDKREVEHSGGVTYMIDTGIAAKPQPIQVENIIDQLDYNEEEIEEASYVEEASSDRLL